VLTAPDADADIGNLDQAQVTGLLAQAKTTTNQASDAISVDKGIGQFGLQPDQLEAAGYLKPGTLSNLQAAPTPTPTAADIAESARINKSGGNTTPEKVAKANKINAMLASPTVWSGKSGVTGLTSLLNNPKLQATAQQGLMLASLTGLRNSGIATGKENPQQLGALIQSATKFGVGAVGSFVKGTSPAALKSSIANTIKGAQFATSFVQSKLGSFSGFAQPAESSTNTVNRSAVDSGVKAALGDSKIPAPVFKPVDRPDDPPSPLDDYRQQFQDKSDEFISAADPLRISLGNLITTLNTLDSQTTINSAQLASIDSQLQSIKQQYTSEVVPIYDELASLKNSAPSTLTEEFTSGLTSLRRTATLITGLIQAVKDYIARLRTRVVV
jgi:hypothetical protein